MATSLFKQRVTGLGSAALVLLGTLSVSRGAPLYFSAFNSPKPVAPEIQGLAPEVVSALEMERVLARARSSEDPAKWRPDLARFSAVPAPQGAALAFQEMARCWEARAQMAEWEKLLRGAYRKKAKFPAGLDDLQAAAPEELRKDPWGEAWVYQATAPAHSPALVGQRYQLGPKRYPQLNSLEFVSKTPPPNPPAGVVFEFFSITRPGAGAAGGVIVSLKVRDTRPAAAQQGQKWTGNYQPGDRIGAYWVVWVQQGGALLGHPDGFVTVAL